MPALNYPVRRILVTGSRDWTDEALVAKVLFGYWYEAGRSNDVVLVHGAAQGLDQMAASIWTKNGQHAEAYPADWNLYGKRAGIIRNLKMIDLQPEHCFAFIKNQSRGASHCAAAADAAGIPTTIFREDSE